MLQLLVATTSLLLTGALALLALRRGWHVAAAIAFGCMLPFYGLLLFSRPVVVPLAVAFVVVGDLLIVAVGILLLLALLNASEREPKPRRPPPADWDEFDRLRVGWDEQGR